jgi:hypothetical protein
MESSRARLSESRRLYGSTAVIIREARVTIDRALEMLGIAPTEGIDKKARSGLLPASSFATVDRLRECTQDEDESAVDIG